MCIKFLYDKILNTKTKEAQQIPSEINTNPGLTRCGLSVVQAGRGRSVIPVAVGVVRTPSDSDIAHRLLELSEAANDWLDQYQPDVVAIERIFERGNVSTVMNTAHGVGVLMLAATAREPSSTQ